MTFAAFLLACAPIVENAVAAQIAVTVTSQASEQSRAQQIAAVEAVVADGGTQLDRRLERLADAGNGYAAWQLGVFVDTGQHNIEVDVDRAFALFTTAAAAGEPNAHASLGLMHATGRGTIVDYVASRLAYAQAVALGVAHGYYGIGVLYGLGQGVDQDHEQALVYFLVAAALEDPEAFTPVGHLLRALPEAALPSIIDRANGLLTAAGRNEHIVLDGNRLSFRRSRSESNAAAAPVD